MLTMKCTEKTGPVVGSLAVEEADELMLMTDGGQSIRIRVSDVRETGRNAQGVKLVTLNQAEKLQAVARVMPDDESDAEPEESESEAAEDPQTDS